MRSAEGIRGSLGKALLAILLPIACAGGEEAKQTEVERAPQIPHSQWEALAELGAGYDTNANGSTSVGSFLGFPLDPRYVATESGFAQAGLTAQNTLNLTPDSGFISSLQLSRRRNPQASFADQTIAALGTEAIVTRGENRFSAALAGYATWLHGKGDERGANIDLNAAHSAGSIESVFTLRAGRISNAQSDFADLEVDRYLAAFSVTRSDIGAAAGSFGVTLIAGHDSPRRADSPFGNDRIGAQLSVGWQIRAGRQAYLELSALRSDYRDPFFDLDRKDDQLSAAAAVEFAGWPGEKWVLAPQLQYVKNDSTVSLFEYDRLEAAIYLRRAL